MENKDNGKWIYYELNTAADELGLRFKTLLQYIITGRIKTEHFEGRYMIRDKELERYREITKVNRAKCGGNYGRANSTSEAQAE